MRSPHPYEGWAGDEELAAGHRMARMCQRWMEANEDAFREIHRFVGFLQQSGCKGRVRDRVAAFCVDRGVEVGDSPYAFNNSWWAGISRYLVLHDPSLLGDPIRFRNSEIDAYGLLPVSYLPETQKEEE